jgi:syntaxin 1B/2/3
MAEKFDPDIPLKIVVAKDDPPQLSSLVSIPPETDKKCDISDIINRTVDPIKNRIDKLNSSIDDIKRLRYDQKDEKKFKTIADNMSKTATELKQLITNMKKDREFQALPKSIIDAIYSKQTFDVSEVMQKYTEAIVDYKKEIRARDKRNLKNVLGEHVTEQQVDEIVESGKVQEVIHKAIISEKLEDVVADIEERHVKIIQLERSILEVFELMKDLANLVEVQGDILNSIDNHVSKARNYVESGENHLKVAEKHQKCSRKLTCCIALILIIIIIAILVPTLGKVLKTS